MTAEREVLLGRCMGWRQEARVYTLRMTQAEEGGRVYLKEGSYSGLCAFVCVCVWVCVCLCVRREGGSVISLKFWGRYI